MRGALDVHRALLEADVAHSLVHLPRALSTADELPEVLGVPALSCLSVRLFALGPAAEARRPGDPRRLDPTEAAAVGVPAGTWPDLVLLARALGTTSLRSASPEEASAVTDCWAGLITPVGLPDGVVLLLDAALAQVALLHVPTGDSGTALRIDAPSLIAVTRARVVDLVPGPEVNLEPPSSAPEEPAARGRRHRPS